MAIGRIMRQLGPAGGRSDEEPEDAAAYAFCLGDVVVGIRLRDGRHLNGRVTRVSYMDHYREKGSVTLSSP